jgi:hypothetical protein
LEKHLRNASSVCRQLFRALINPCANQRDLFLGEGRRRRAESAGTTRSALSTRPTGKRVAFAGTARSANSRTARTTRTTGRRIAIIRAAGLEIPLPTGATRSGDTTGPIGTSRSAGTSRRSRTSRTTRSTWRTGAALGRHGDFVIELRDGGNEQTFFAVARHDNLAVLTPFERGFEAIQSHLTLLPLFTVAAKARRFQDGADVLRVGNTFLFGGGRQFAEIKFTEVPLVITLDWQMDQREPDQNQCGFCFHG